MYISEASSIAPESVNLSQKEDVSKRWATERLREQMTEEVIDEGRPQREAILQKNIFSTNIDFS